jgi:AbrB family looped-hinge helix DNA binding protein
MQLTIDRFGRMVLPKSMRDGLGLIAGDRVEAELSPGAVTLRPSSCADCTAREGRVLVFSGKAAGDIGGTLARVREGRLDRAGGTGGHA